MTKRKVVTEADVLTARQKGEKLEISDSDILTPAARDIARQDDRSNKPTNKQPATTTVAIGADHGGYDMKEFLKKHLEELGATVTDLGCDNKESVDYPVYAARVAEAVAAGQASIGIMVDGAGIGSSMVGNKTPGVRAALCYDLTTAENARQHNNANMLTLGGTLIGNRLAGEIVKVFLNTPFEGGRHLKRVAMIDSLDSA